MRQCQKKATLIEPRLQTQRCILSPSRSGTHVFNFVCISFVRRSRRKRQHRHSNLPRRQQLASNPGHKKQ